MKRTVRIISLAALLWATGGCLDPKPADHKNPSATAAAPADSDWHEGDILFHTSRSAQSQAIQLATHSHYSHCGIVMLHDGEWMVCEAVQPVGFTPVGQWIARGLKGEYVVKRLRQTPSANDILKLRAQCLSMVGKDYDLTFEWSDTNIYCSELIWKAYQRAMDLELGRVQHLRDFDLSHPTVKNKLRERYGNHIPMDEPVISPQAILESPLLRTVEVRR